MTVWSCPTTSFSRQVRPLEGAAFHDTLLLVTKQAPAKHPCILRPLPVHNTGSDYTAVVQNMGFLSYYTIQQYKWTLERDKVRRKHTNLALKEDSQEFPVRNSSKYDHPPPTSCSKCTFHRGLAEPLCRKLRAFPSCLLVTGVELVI